MVKCEDIFSFSFLFLSEADLPQSPRIEISGELKEYQTVTITCSAPILCPRSPPRLTWSLPLASDKTRHSSVWNSTVTIQTTLHLSDNHDGFYIRCVSTQSVNTGEDKTSEGIQRLKVSCKSLHVLFRALMQRSSLTPARLSYFPQTGLRTP